MNKNLKVVVTSIIATIFSVLVLNICLFLGRSYNLEMLNSGVVVNTLLELVILFTQIFVLKIFRKDKSMLDDLGLKISCNIFKNIIIVIIFTAMYIFLSYTCMCLINIVEFQGIGFEFYSLDVVNSCIYNAFMLSIFASSCEEVFFRGVLCKYLSRFKGDIFGIVVSLIIFSIAHAGRNIDIKNFVIIFFYGLVLGYLYIKTKSLYLSIAVHFMIDFIEFSIGLDSAGLFLFKKCSNISSELLSNADFFLHMSVYGVFVFLYFVGKRFVKRSEINVHMCDKKSRNT